MAKRIGAATVGSSRTPKLAVIVLFCFWCLATLVAAAPRPHIVVFLADDVLFRSFWENGKLLLCNAVFLVGQ